MFVLSALFFLRKFSINILAAQRVSGLGLRYVLCNAFFTHR